MEFKTQLPKVEAEFKGDTLSLTNVKVCARLSEETTCFTANLKRNGKLVAYVSNRGQGGCNDLDFVDNEYRKSLSYEDWQKLAEDVVTELLTLYEGVDYTKKQQGKGLVVRKMVTIEGTDYSYPEYSLAVLKCGGKSRPIKEILDAPMGKDTILQMASQLQKQGFEILNANLSCLNEQTA